MLGKNLGKVEKILIINQNIFISLLNNQLSIKTNMPYFRIIVICIIYINSLTLNGQSKQRLISLAPLLTKMIYLLDNQGNLVGCTNYCTVAVKDHKSIVSTGMEVNIEKIILLKPDLVITTSLTKPSITETLKKNGLRIQVFNLPDSYDELCKLFIDLGSLMDKSKKALEIISKQQKRLNIIKLSLPANKKPGVFFEIGIKPIFTVIPNTFMDDYIKYAGGINIAADLSNGLITKESVLIRNPDVIFIENMGLMARDEELMWRGYKNINAVKNNKIFFLDADDSCSPDPVKFVDVVELMVKLMYK